MSISDRTFILADHSKWQNTSLSLFASFDAVDAVIADSELPATQASATRELVKELVLADEIGPQTSHNVHGSTARSTSDER